MVVSEEKTKYQVFTPARSPLNVQIKYNNKPLEKPNSSKYLGVHFIDSKLTWNDHIEKSTTKAIKKFKLLKRLAGTKWGSSRTTLNTTYNTYIKPTLTYCSEALVTINKTTQYKLEKVQNEALRLITGAVKTTPINALYALTQSKPLSTTIEENALIQYEKIVRVPNNTIWEKFQRKPAILKTQSGFVQEVKRAKRSQDLPEFREMLNPIVNPLLKFEIEYFT